VVVRDTAPVIQQVIWNSELPDSMFVEKMSFPGRDRAEIDLREDYLYFSMLLLTKLVGMKDDAITNSLQRLSSEISLELTSEWHPSLRCMIELQDPSQGSAYRMISGPSELPKWETSDKVVLIGHVIHVMAQGGGVGVATALKGASILPDKLVSGGLTKESIGAFEYEMRGYAEACIRRSFAGGKMFFGQSPFELCKEAIFKDSVRGE
jgi:2-polyprenyl-6-methoxyphenol hydroxylase-like FAD-dependent oxidoreductase